MTPESLRSRSPRKVGNRQDLTSKPVLRPDPEAAEAVTPPKLAAGGRVAASGLVRITANRNNAMVCVKPPR